MKYNKFLDKKSERKLNKLYRIHMKNLPKAISRKLKYIAIGFSLLISYDLEDDTLYWIRMLKKDLDDIQELFDSVAEGILNDEYENEDTMEENNND